jgi:hypothetical protein
VHRGPDLAVEAREPFGGVSYLETSRTGRLPARDTRADRRARQDHDESWQARMAPA